MKGLLLMNGYYMKMYLRQYLLLLLFFMIFGVSTSNSYYIMGMALVVGVNVCFSSFGFEEAGGYGYLLSTPVTRKSMVRAKYLMQLAGAAFIIVCSVVGESINRMLRGSAEKGWLVSLISILGIYFIFIGVLVPVAYRYTTEKARIVMLGMVAVPMVLVFLGARLLQVPILLEALDAISSLFTLDQIVSYAIVFFFAISVLVLGVSYLLSVRIFEKMEF